ncbi:hypothetical protein BDQ17DRAFT_1348451 [Cyathus striatus]|nr:hypothetical protein BDQ17DRAFT_1348451 [Cyathus striatus]
MTILIVGGTGKTGLKLAHLLRAANIPLLITSRSGIAPESFPAVKFDWSNPSTFSAPFDKDPSIDRVYFVGPAAVDMIPIAKPFIDLAIEKGVKKWVVLSAAQSSKGGLWAGSVHQYLHDRGVEYTVLRPSWFHENFSYVFGESIRKRNEIVTTAEDGRIPFIAAQDIAQAAFEALTTDEYKYAEPYILGPELLTYDEAAALLSEALGRKITHRRLSTEEVAQGFMSIGLTDNYANVLANAEKRLASGAEEKLFFVDGGKTVKYIGKARLREYIEKNKELWAAV